MPTAAIVAEYNPFHRGHAWQVAETRRRLGENTAIVCCMSGHWTQGADCAVADKWSRAALALAGGVDLVLELPLPYAIASAEGFARGAVAVLHATGVVDTLSFGSEGGDIAPLQRVAQCLDSPQYQLGLHPLLGTGLSFPAARQAAVQGVLGQGADCLSHPNNNLGIEYLRALNALGSAITPMTVLRRGASHNGAAGTEAGFASATQIRALLRGGERVGAEALLNPDALERLPQAGVSNLSWLERAMLARLRTMTLDEFSALPDAGARAGLPARMMAAARQACTMEDFFVAAKTRSYTHARLRRLALCAMLGVTEADRPPEMPYVRVLGFNETGRGLLRGMKRACTLPVLTKPAHAKLLEGVGQRLFALEARSTDLYALCFDTPRPCGMEWTQGPVVATDCQKD